MRKIIGIILLSITLAACVPATEEANQGEAPFEKGIFMSGGTISDGTGLIGTHFMVAMSFGDLGGESFAQVPVTVVGPAGWNHGEPFIFTGYAFSQNAYTNYNPQADSPAVTGSYTASVEWNDTVYTTTFAVAAEQVIEAVESVTVVTAQTDELEFHWNPVPGAAAYGVSVFDPSEETMIPIPYTNTTETTLRIAATGAGPLDLAPGVYAVRVDTLSSDTIATEEWDTSLQVNVGQSEYFELSIE